MTSVILTYEFIKYFNSILYLSKNWLFLSKYDVLNAEISPQFAILTRLFTDGG